MLFAFLPVFTCKYDAFLLLKKVLEINLSTFRFITFFVSHETKNFDHVIDGI